MTYLSEARGGVPDLVDHSPHDGGHRYIGAVGKGFLIPIKRSSRLLVTRLVEVGLWHQYE